MRTKVGSPAKAFGFGLLVVIIWAATGPIYHYSDTWQLVINTGTSVVTFLMVFLIQNTQNRDAQAMQLKLNELIRAVSTARNVLVDLENCTEEEIKEIRAEFTNIRARISAKAESNKELNGRSRSSTSGPSSQRSSVRPARTGRSGRVCRRTRIGPVSCPPGSSAAAVIPAQPDPTGRLLFTRWSEMNFLRRACKAMYSRASLVNRLRSRGLKITFRTVRQITFVRK